jgi:hypothetical protein
MAWNFHFYISCFFIDLWGIVGGCGYQKLSDLRLYFVMLREKPEALLLSIRETFTQAEIHRLSGSG